MVQGKLAAMAWPLAVMMAEFIVSLLPFIQAVKNHIVLVSENAVLPGRADDEICSMNNLDLVGSSPHVECLSRCVGPTRFENGDIRVG